MADLELTRDEMQRLLALRDAQNLDDYDEEFYRLLTTEAIPGAEELDDRIRRAILKYISDWWSFHSRAQNLGKFQVVEYITGFTLFLLVLGYSLGMKLGRPLTRTPTPPG